MAHGGPNIHVGRWMMVPRLVYVLYFFVLCTWLGKPAVGWFHPESFGDDKNIVSFNWHIVYMSVAFIFAFPEGILSYKYIEESLGATHDSAKMFHAGFNIVGFALTCAGIFVVFANHGAKSIPHLTSAHSWIGGIVAICLCLQLLPAFIYVSGSLISKDGKEALRPWHRFFGQVAYIGGCVAMCMGFQEKIGFLKVAVAADPSIRLYGNLLVLLICVQMGLVSLILCSEDQDYYYKVERDNRAKRLKAYGATEGEDGSETVAIAEEGAAASTI